MFSLQYITINVREPVEEDVECGGDEGGGQEVRLEPGGCPMRSRVRLMLAFGISGGAAEDPKKL
jgi:hypothetical protein